MPALVARVAIVKYRQLGGINNKFIIPYMVLATGNKSERNTLTGLISSEVCEENVFQASLLAFGGFLAIFGISWFTKASP
jgi:hypothetical protein